jgi:thiamine-monophosphate kinase
MVRHAARPGPPTFSERGFHAWLRAEFEGIPTGTLAMGDDAAALPLGGGRVAVLTSDALVEGTHFLPGSPPAAVGRAAAGVSLSDAASKGAGPVALLVDLLLPPRTPESWARAVVRGAEQEMVRHGGHVVGGDTKPSPTRTVVGALLAIGTVEQLCPRSAGRPGDVLVTTGTVGRGGADAAALAPGRRPTRRDLARLLTIQPRTREGPILARFAHAMLDTSDGVADGARSLAEASGVSAVVSEESLPLDPRLARMTGGVQARRAAAFFGGDYELLAALPRESVGAARRALGRVGCPLTVIGNLERGRGAWLDSGGGRSEMPPGGWRPFEARGGRPEPGTS